MLSMAQMATIRWTVAAATIPSTVVMITTPSTVVLVVILLVAALGAIALSIVTTLPLIIMMAVAASTPLTTLKSHLGLVSLLT